MSNQFLRPQSSIIYLISTFFSRREFLKIVVSQIAHDPYLREIFFNLSSFSKQVSNFVYIVSSTAFINYHNSVSDEL